MISDDDALRLTALAALMADAARATPGGMLAVLDLDPAVVAALVDELGSAAGIVVANDNSAPAEDRVAGTHGEACNGCQELVAQTAVAKKQVVLEVADSMGIARLPR